MLPWDKESPQGKTALWFLGQSGFLLAGGCRRVVIDPYLSDSVGKLDPLFSRAYPVPVNPAELLADIFIVTHNHLDHLDPETVEAYPAKKDTWFVAPRMAAERLISLSVPREKIIVVDYGGRVEIDDITIEGVFALATGSDVLDTTGYKITMPGGQSVCHTSDTSFCDLLLEAYPKTDVLLPCINGKFGNLTVEQAVLLTKSVAPRYVIPHHYDVMSLNAENPESFRYFLSQAEVLTKCHILDVMQEFTWE